MNLTFIQFLAVKKTTISFDNISTQTIKFPSFSMGTYDVRFTFSAESYVFVRRWHNIKDTVTQIIHIFMLQMLAFRIAKQRA